MAKQIYSFKKGDIITRIENAKIRSIRYNENLGIEMESILAEDSSYRGEPLEFLAIENNMCYCKGVLGLFNGLNIKFELGNGWEEGWDYYVEVNDELKEAKQPKTHFEKSFSEIDSIISYTPYSHSVSLNFLFIKRYNFLFMNNIIDRKWFFLKSSAKRYVDILNGAFMAGSLHSVINKIKSKWTR